MDHSQQLLPGQLDVFGDLRRATTLTYDADDRVLELYRGLRCVSFGIAHTAATQHIGREFGVFADDLEVPALELLGRAGDAVWLPQTIISS